MGPAEIALLDGLARLGHVSRPYHDDGPELFVVARKVAHVTLGSDLPKDQRWPTWLYTAHDAYRCRPRVFPIVAADGDA
jgi:hypothetical protein